MTTRWVQTIAPGGTAHAVRDIVARRVCTACTLWFNEAELEPAPEYRVRCHRCSLMLRRAALLAHWGVGGGA